MREATGPSLKALAWHTNIIATQRPIGKKVFQFEEVSRKPARCLRQMMGIMITRGKQILGKREQYRRRSGDSSFLKYRREAENDGSREHESWSWFA